MKKYLFMALAAAVLCVLFASCDKDNDDIIPSSDDKEATYYDYSENGFFMNGDIKIRGYFDRDSIMEGYTKYVRRTAHYRTVDGEEGEFVFGYGLVVGINDLARFYSDDITYNADSTAIDDKFYQLAKRYRKSTDEDAEQKLADLSAAYNIASGRRDEEEQRELAHDQAKKIFGKTAEDWKTFFGYNWIKFVLGAGLIVFIISLVNFFTQGGNSCTVISFGNFGHTTSYISSVLELYGYSNPYVATVDYIVPNTEGLQNQQYADQTLAAFFSADPNVLITDEMTYVYYFSQFADLTDAYDIIMDEIPEDVAAAITPIYMSEREAYNLTKTYYEQIYEIQDYDAEIDESELSDKQIMIGLEITDPDMIEKLGFENWWHKQPPTLVFGIFSNTSSLADSIQVLITILKAAA